NSDRLMKLIQEICEMLEAKQERLQQPGKRGRAPRSSRTVRLGPTISAQRRDSMLARTSPSKASINARHVGIRAASFLFPVTTQPHHGTNPQRIDCPPHPVDP